MPWKAVNSTLQGNITLTRKQCHITNIHEIVKLPPQSWKINTNDGNYYYNLKMVYLVFLIVDA